MKLTYKKGAIEIFVKKGFRSTEGEMKPTEGFRICQEIPFAFRRIEMLFDTSGFYEITHIPTGLKMPITERAGNYFNTFKNTRTFLEKLADTGIDFNFTDCATDSAKKSLKQMSEFVFAYPF